MLLNQQHFFSSYNVNNWRKLSCRILSDEREETKEDILGTPSDRSVRHNVEPFDSAQQTHGNNTSYRKPSDHVTPFDKRTSKFVVQLTVNNPPSTENVKTENKFENLDDDIIRRVQPIKRCSLLVHGKQPEPGCRFMYNRIEDMVCDTSYSGEPVHVISIYLFLMLTYDFGD